MINRNETIHNNINDYIQDKWVKLLENKTNKRKINVKRTNKNIRSQYYTGVK